MKELSHRANEMKQSLTVAITSKAIAMKNSGVDIISLGAGEPDFDTPMAICEAAKKCIDMGKTKYDNAGGLLELRVAIADKIEKENGVKVKPSQIVVSNGGKQAVSNTIAAIVDKGDEVIVFAPYWVSYPSLVSFYGGTPVILETTAENTYKIEIAQLRAAITPKTKAIVINSPCNPTGSVYSKEELASIAEIVEEYDLFVISDEIYERIVYGDTKHHTIAAYSNKLAENTIIINGFSKSFAMTGWRIGYSVCNEVLAKKILGIQSQLTHHNAMVYQYAALEALTNSSIESEVEVMRAEYEKRRALICSELEGFPDTSYVVPHGAFYIFLNVEKLYNDKVKNSLEMIEYILDEAKVVTMPGDGFGDPKTIRLSYANSQENIIEAIRRIKDAFAKL